MQALETEAARGQNAVFWSLMRRSAWALLVVVVIIVLIAIVPSSSVGSGDWTDIGAEGASTLRHTLVLHRHGAPSTWRATAPRRFLTIWHAAHR